MTRLDGLMFWVADVPATVGFYEEAFGLQRRWLRDEGDYAQMDTGAVVLQFAAESAAPSSGVEIRAHRVGDAAAAVQLSLAVDDVPAAHGRALTAGAMDVAAPVTKPWGQVVAYVRDRDGILVELTTAGD
jgi:catechol 2,3-dioxygenase-like lactoylglutathione lyase family enzyme